MPDGTNRLRRMYHDDAPPRHRAIQLGQAVVASPPVCPACSNRSDLMAFIGSRKKARWPSRSLCGTSTGVCMTTKGSRASSSRDAVLFLVSDASGQTALAVDPGGGHIGTPDAQQTPYLCNAVRAGTVRPALDSMLQGGLLKGAMFIHLKQES